MVERRKEVVLDCEAMSEAELVSHVRRGVRDAFRVIMQRYNQPLFRVARGIVSDDAEAEDVVQESYFRAFAAFHTFRSESSLLTWLTRITINEARGRLRRRRRQMVDLDEVETAQATGALVVAFPGGRPMDNPEADAARAQIRLLIEQAVDSLAEPFRLVFILRDVQDCSIEETAERLGIRPETVKTRLHRARLQLRAALEETLASSIRDTFPFLGRRCERITETVLGRLSKTYGWDDSASESVVG
ncbi:RNA polymerase sigma factor [uncultured Caulobacter sp.]|jgi:RNA polymerase sigma-70 factor (ECF subfamily)|uniref:RNA polymerase sigma factor n=1 Tax=uncultured Caulobacter sp. TaxID=158749 RepID=UPI002633DC92|nr:RNA polymerase sigma factor [uncultured Caulobacter sp.]